MHTTQRQQTTDLLKSRSIDRALFTHPESVRWLTGFAPSIELGLTHFAGGPHAIWYEAGHYTLIILDQYAPEAAGLADDHDVTVVTYLGYTIEQPLRSGANLVEVLRSVIAPSTSTSMIGIEYQTTTTLMLREIVQRFSSSEITATDDWLVPLRMIKTDEELAKLRESFRLTNLAHAVARQVVAAGQREIDVWMAVQSAINRAAGMRIALGNDCVAGTRSPNNIGGWPLDIALQEGDSLTVDISTIYKGYWSDSCMTYYAGERSAKAAKVHQDVRDALDFAISLIRPGIAAREVDRQVREFIAKAGYPVYPHHTGHAVGVSAHEAPRIVPYNDEILQAGMVILVEPGVYFPGELSIRLEDALLIKPDGVELLTQHSKA